MPKRKPHYEWLVKHEPPYVLGENILRCRCGEEITVTTPTPTAQYKKVVQPFYDKHKDC